MRKIAFIIGIIGLALLIGFLLFDGKYVKTLDGLVVGQSVVIRGVVEESRDFSYGKILVVRDIPVFCECVKDYVGSNVEVYGIVEKFPEDLRIRAFTIKVLD